MTARRRFDDLPVAQQAGMLCADARFRRYVAERLGLDGAVSQGAAAEFVRRLCRVESRRELDHRAVPAAVFASLRADFDVWRGRVAEPRPP